MFSDQQIVTGIAILAAGYAKHCTISVYHFQVVVYLAWMSSGTHLVTLTVLRKYLRDEPTIRTWRIAGMSILFVLLIVALFPITAGNWSELVVASKITTGSAVIPAQCFWRTGDWAYWNSYSLVSYLFLLSSYTSKAGALFAKGEGFFSEWLRKKPGRLFKRGLDRSSRYAASSPGRFRWLRRTLFNCLLVVFAIALAVFDLYGSFIASILYLLLALFFGSWQIYFPRWNIPTEMLAAENAFGFGQFVPLLLVPLPLFSALEIYKGTCSRSVPFTRVQSCWRSL